MTQFLVSAAMLFVSLVGIAGWLAGNSLACRRGRHLWSRPYTEQLRRIQHCEVCRVTRPAPVARVEASPVTTQTDIDGNAPTGAVLIERDARGDNVRPLRRGAR
jgi:hypothetical protein